MTNNVKNSLVDYAWKYFAFHANQRIALFRFYIGIYTLYLTATGYMLFHDNNVSNGDKNVVLIVSVLFLIITMIFYGLDQRNRDLIHLAEESLRKYENEMSLDKPHNIFTIEDREAREKLQFRHTHFFNAFFLIGCCTALIGAACALFSS